MHVYILSSWFDTLMIDKWRDNIGLYCIQEMIDKWRDNIGLYILYTGDEEANIAQFFCKTVGFIVLLSVIICITYPYLSKMLFLENSSFNIQFKQSQSKFNFTKFELNSWSLRIENYWL